MRALGVVGAAGEGASGAMVACGVERWVVMLKFRGVWLWLAWKS